MYKITGKDIGNNIRIIRGEDVDHSLRVII